MDIGKYRDSKEIKGRLLNKGSCRNIPKLFYNNVYFRINNEKLCNNCLEILCVREMLSDNIIGIYDYILIISKRKPLYMKSNMIWVDENLYNVLNKDLFWTWRSGNSIIYHNDINIKKQLIVKDLLVRNNKQILYYNKLHYKYLIYHNNFIKAKDNNSKIKDITKYLINKCKENGGTIRNISNLI